MPGYTNNELEYLQRAARELFGDNSLRISQYGSLAGVIVLDRLVVHDDDCDRWFVAHAPATQPHLIDYVGDCVTSIEDVAKRQQEVQVAKPSAHGWHRPEA